MRIIGWNINGLRGKSMDLFTNKNKEFNINSHLNTCIQKYKPDVMCFGETKCQDIHTHLLDLLPFKYKTAICSKARKGYSGVCILSNKEFTDLGSLELNDNDIEGRSRIVEFDNCILIYVYTPNSGARYDYRIYWDNVVKDYLEKLNKTDKMVVYCGDLNVVHEYNDIYSSFTLDKGKLPGTLLEERFRFKNILNLGYIDIWRELNENIKKYTWWDPRSKARISNSGFRIDYFLIKEKDKKKVVDTLICDDIFGSDHCPIYIEIE